MNNYLLIGLAFLLFVAGCSKINDENSNKTKSYSSLSELIEAIASGVTTVKHSEDISFKGANTLFLADKIDINGIINARIRWSVDWNDKDTGVVLLSLADITKIKNSLTSLINTVKSSPIPIRTRFSINIGSLEIACGYDADRLGAQGYRNRSPSEKEFYIDVSNSYNNSKQSQKTIVDFLERFNDFLLRIENIAI
jgi:hypothetical protein